MQAQRIDNMLNFPFQKSAEEIRGQAAIKVYDIEAKIEERIKRVKKTREDYGITDAVLNDIMIQMREQEKRGHAAQMYTSKTLSDDQNTEREVSVGAGVINMLLTENDYIEVEKSHVAKLKTIMRNLQNIKKVTSNGVEYNEPLSLSYAELTFLGF